jgi:lactam utilization protein B
VTAVIDLNADAGEGFGVYAIGADAEVLDSVTSLKFTETVTAIS